LDLIWALRERAEQGKRHPVILAATRMLRPLCLEAGLSLTPLGDVAIIDLEQAARTPLRDGFSLALAAPGSDAAPLLALARLWRDHRRSGSGGFVIGPATVPWLGRNICAVLRWNGGLAGFAVILQGARGEAWAIDRTVLDPSLVDTLGMDVLLGALVEGLCAAGRSVGVRDVSLGLTPAPAIDDDPLAAAWRRLPPALYGLGDLLPDPQAQRTFKARFATRFEPRYLACPGGWALPEILLDVTTLIERGPDR
ncbi:MAG: phosphatidylglycerol lysyltransferase domain-containing protein, partial [bacterium]